jgi:hypothetical protein
MKMEMVLDDEIGRRTDRRTDGTIAPAGAALRKQTREGSIKNKCPNYTHRTEGCSAMRIVWDFVDGVFLSQCCSVIGEICMVADE